MRYQPRVELVHPMAFGLLPEPELDELNATDSRRRRALRRAALLHNRFAFLVGQHRARSGMSVMAFAAKIGVEYEHASRLLHGAATLRLSDITATEDLFGESFSEELADFFRR